MERLIAWVPGVAQPGGSKRGFVVKSKATGRMRAIITEDASKNKDWRASVKHFVGLKWGGTQFQGPLMVKVTFVMPRPASHFKTGKNAGEVKENAPEWCTKRPDTTKLWRSTEDALTDLGVWADDSQVSAQSITRIYGFPCGARIEIFPLVEPRPGLSNLPHGLDKEF